MRAHILALATALALLNPLAQAAMLEVDGVRYENPIKLANQPLQLNGVATKHNKEGVKNFTVALYLASKMTSTAAVLAAPGPKRLRFTFLKEANADKMRFLTMGLEANLEKTEYAKTFGGVLRLAELFGIHMRFFENDTLTLDYLPGTGTQILLNDQPQGAPVPEPEFFKAMLLLWLGQHPADPKMKVKLLGGA